MARETTITIETKSLLILRSASSTKAWCPVCAAQVEMLLLDIAGLTAGHAPELAQWLNSAGMHCVEGADGSSLLCLDSLLARALKDKPTEKDTI